MIVHEVQGMALVTPKNPVALKKLLTVTSTDDKPYTLYLYKEVEGSDPLKLWVPRSLKAVRESGLQVSGSWAPLGMSTKFTLRPNQVQLFNDFHKTMVTTHPYGGIIKAPTGVGKSILGIKVTEAVALKTLVIVPLDGLVKQWVNNFLTWTDLEENDIGIIRGPQCDFHGKKVCVAMLHSLAQKEYPARLYDNFGLVIYDEIHQLGAETFSTVAPLFNSKVRLGLSATPRRKNGTEKVFLLHIGDIVSKHDTLQVIPKIYVVKYTGADASHAGCVYGGKLSLGRYFNRLEKSKSRNELLTRLIFNVYGKGRDILGLGDRVAQLYTIRENLLKLGVPDEDIGICTNKVKQLNRKIILGTYGSVGMGVDIPRLDTLIFLTPRTDVEQAIGRILRSMVNKKEPVVLDIVDTSSGIMQGWYRKREVFYRRVKAQIMRKEQ